MSEAQTPPRDNAPSRARASTRAGSPNALYSSHLSGAVCAQVQFSGPVIVSAATPEIAQRHPDVG
jgi:hypothetical protein